MNRKFKVFKTDIELHVVDNCEYIYKFHRILQQFSNHSNDVIDRIVLEIYENSVVFIRGNIVRRYSDFMPTDVYPFLYSIIYDAARRVNIIGMHSAVIEKNDVAIGICGGFGAGKSTLALEFAKNGWNIISSDQSFYKIDDGKVFFQTGTVYMKYNDEEYFLPKVTNSHYEIDKMIVIKGVAENGDLKVDELSSQRLHRELWNELIWPWSTLICNYSRIEDYNVEINQRHVIDFLNRINVNADLVRGDSGTIVKYYEGKYMIRSYDK